MNRKLYYDPWVFLASLFLVGMGLVMVTSASIALNDAAGLAALKFAIRQGSALLIGLVLAIIVTFIPTRFWRSLGPPMLLFSLVSLSLLFIPGLGKEVNGSIRWLKLGSLSFQPSEFVKLAFIIYMASFLVRRHEEVKTEWSGFLKPTFILSLISALLLLEPDFGTAVVIVITIMGMLFLGGVPFRRFLILFLLAVSGLLILSITSPYRMLRLTTFLNPWADQFNTGYQLTQSLIAFGRGGWLGLGLGASIQKLLYLPEPHTDFLYAVLAEELGLLGALLVLICFAILIMKALNIGRRAVLSSHPFQGYLAYGIGLWLGVQSLINIGVNIGLLPTKGLTLPFMSYGGNSLIVSIIALGFLFRIDFELRTQNKMVNHI